MIVRFGLEEDIYGKIHILENGDLGFIGNEEKLRKLVDEFTEEFRTRFESEPTNEELLAFLLESLREKQHSMAWAEYVEPGPHALRHPMTEYLCRTGKLHPDYFDAYFEN